MNKLLIAFFTGISLILFSCGQPHSDELVDEGKVDKNTYTSKEIGWTMNIPEGWTITNKEQTQQRSERGAKAIGETLDAEVDLSGLKNLIAFQKNKFNVFQSTSEYYGSTDMNEWEQHNGDLKKLLYDTYQSQGIKVDTTVTTTETIDGLEFESYCFTIYGPKGERILEQIMYSRLINGYDFGVNINSNNEKDKQEMLKAFKSSKFKK